MKSRSLLLIAAAGLALASFAAQAAGIDVQGFIAAHSDIVAGLGALSFAGSIKTQGTKLYFANPADHVVHSVDCMTSFNPGGAPADQLEDTCMEDVSGVRSYKPGLRTPGQGSIVINADPKNASHILLFELSQGDVQNLQWALGWSDGTAAPTSLDSNGTFNLPHTRTWYTFEGYVADFPFDFALNALVTSTVPIQRSGAGVWIPKTA